MLVRSAHCKVGLSCWLPGKRRWKWLCFACCVYRALGNMRKCLHTLYLLWHCDNHKDNQGQRKQGIKGGKCIILMQQYGHHSEVHAYFCLTLLLVLLLEKIYDWNTNFDFKSILITKPYTERQISAFLPWSMEKDKHLHLWSFAMHGCNVKNCRQSHCILGTWRS